MWDGCLRCLVRLVLALILGGLFSSVLCSLSLSLLSVAACREWVVLVSPSFCLPSFGLLLPLTPLAFRSLPAKLMGGVIILMAADVALGEPSSRMD